MAYSTINKHTDYFNTKLYTGNGTAIGSGGQSQTGVGFQPDLTWIKCRSNQDNHALTDSIRGVTKIMTSDSSGAEQTIAETLTAFGTDGFTTGNNSKMGASGRTYCAWNWKAGTTSGITTDGNTTITPSSYSINQTAGFSILKFTGNGVTGAKLAHGLGGTPANIVIKKIDATGDWAVYHKDIATGKNMWWNYTQAETADNLIYSPDATNITLLNHSSVNNNGTVYIAYCWKEVTGYSKFGSYVGSSNASGTYVYTGMKPSFVLLKKRDGAEAWLLMDNKRQGYNPENEYLVPNSDTVEGTANHIDLLSNGFKLTTNGGGFNVGNFIYMAFGQSLVGSNNVPCTAR